MFAGVRATLPQVKAVMKDDFDVVQLPKINGVRRVGMGSIALALTENGRKNSKVSYDFLNWFFAEDGGMRILAAGYAVVPPSPPLFNSPIWRGLAPPPYNNDAFVQAMANGVENPAGIPANLQGKIDDSITNAVQAVLIGGMTVEDAFSRAQKELDKAFAESRGEAQ